MPVRPAHADEEAARGYFRRGVEAYDKKEYGKALAAFEAAYREKPSAGIKQNIGLTLKAQGKLVDAARAFDEAIDEGRATLKPETRAAIEQELAELSKVLITLDVKVVTGAGAAQKPVDDVIVSIDGKALPAGAHRRSIRLDPQTSTRYEVSVHAPGFADPAPRVLVFAPGEPVDVTFVVSVGTTGVLVIDAKLPNAVLKIDGVVLAQRGRFEGPVDAGKHTIEASAPGYRTAVQEITVPAGGTIENPITLHAVGDAPDPYTSPDRAPPRKPKKAYAFAMVSIGGAGYRFSEQVGEESGGKRRGVGGGSFSARVGYYVSKTISLELFGEIGGLGANYRSSATLPGIERDTETTVVHFQLTPMARFTTQGKIRFTIGTGLGLHTLAVESKIPIGANTARREGDGISASWLGDIGLQIEAGPVLLEPAFFLDVHGVGTVRNDEAPHDRLLLASPSTRAGVRLGLGLPF